MDGILLIDKPKGWTSFDVVAKVRGLIRQSTGQKKPKVGHCGTLDPLATGLLVIVVGSYTKKASELSKKDKTYQEYKDDSSSFSSPATPKIGNGRYWMVGSWATGGARRTGVELNVRDDGLSVADDGLGTTEAS